MSSEQRPFVPKTPMDFQKMKLDRLMANPDKPVVIPETSREKKGFSVPEFVRNVMGSSAGAGSGEFHVYRHLRRKEYTRQKMIEEKGEKEKLDDEYFQKIEENKRKMEEKTARKRAKRLKKKAKLKKLKSNKPSKNTEKDSCQNETESSSEESSSGKESLDEHEIQNDEHEIQNDECEESENVRQCTLSESSQALDSEKTSAKEGKT